MEAFSDLKREDSNLMSCIAANKKPYHERAVKAARLCHKSREGLGPITIYLRLFVILDIMTHSVLVREKRFVYNKDDKRKDLSQRGKLLLSSFIVSAHSCIVLLLNK